MLQSLLPRKPVMWNDLIGGADHTLTKLSLPQQSSFLSTSALSGRESMTGRDDVKSEPFTLGSADLGNLLADPYTEEDARILSTACYFTSDDVEGSEEGMPLFGGATDGIKTDYNWDQCFGNLEDVDNLLSVGPDLSFGPAPAGHAVDSMQWHDSASPPAVHPENATIAKSPLRTSECATRADQGKLDATNLRMEFVPSDARRAQPKVEVGVKTVDYMPGAGERWSNPQSGSQFMASDCLEDGEAMAGGHVSLPKMNGGTCVGMDMSEDGAGASSVSHSDSEKATMAQVQRARRHAANRKRIEERSRRQLNHRKFVHGSAYSNSHVPRPHNMLQPMPVQLAAHGNHFSQPPTAAAVYGFVAPRSNLSPVQPLLRPAAPYIHVGYTPSIRHIQPVPPTPVSPQAGLFMGYQQPGSFQPAVMAAPHQQFQLRAPMDPPPPSSSSMTPREKIEKLKYLQQMQARLAVEHQQQQFVAQGAAPMDSTSLGVTVTAATQLPQIIPAVRQPDTVPVSTVSEMKMSAVDSDFEPSLSVGQTSLDTASEDESGSMEAAVLDTLQNTAKSLGVETKLCIRDALYRLARSAMRRNGSGGRGGGEESGNNAQATEDGDAASDGLESSINSDPCSSSRVSRMNMNMVETQTNPIDRSIAHLLFHKTSQQQQGPPAQSAPSNVIVSPQVLGFPDGQPNPPTWHKGDLPQSSWQQPGASSQIAVPVTDGVEIGHAGSIRAPMALVIPATALMGPRPFQGPPPGIIIADHGGQQMHDGLNHQNGDSSLSSPMGSTAEIPLQAQSAPVAAAAAAAPVKVSLDCRNGIRNAKRLEHALGLKELSQLLSEGLEVDSGALCKEELTASSGSPLSNGSNHVICNEDGQAGNGGQQQSRSYPSQRRMHRQGEAMRSC